MSLCRSSRTLNRNYLYGSNFNLNITDEISRFLPRIPCVKQRNSPKSASWRAILSLSFTLAEMPSICVPSLSVVSYISTVRSSSPDPSAALPSSGASLPLLLLVLRSAAAPLMAGALTVDAGADATIRRPTAPARALVSPPGRAQLRAWGLGCTNDRADDAWESVSNAIRSKRMMGPAALKDPSFTSTQTKFREPRDSSSGGGVGSKRRTRTHTRDQEVVGLRSWWRSKGRVTLHSAPPPTKKCGPIYFLPSILSPNQSSVSRRSGFSVFRLFSLRTPFPLTPVTIMFWRGAFFSSLMFITDGQYPSAHAFEAQWVPQEPEVAGSHCSSLVCVDETTVHSRCFDIGYLE